MRRVLLAVLTTFWAVAAAHASVISYELNYEFSGATAPAGTGPWLTATFDDGGSAGSVTLTLTSNLLEETGFFGGVYFNFDPSQNAGSVLSFTADPGWSSATWGNDCCKADGDGLYDFNLDFNSNVFGGNDVYQMELFGTGITADMFGYESTPDGGNGTYHVAAHVQGLGRGGEESGWIGDTPRSVPEPTSLGLLGLGLLGLGLVKRLRKA